jgi:DNA repair exonuclease SbcCD ATPase subunit
MEAYSQINQFLIRVQKSCNRIRLILGTYLFFTALLGALLCVALFYYLQPLAISYYASILLFLIIGKYLYSTARSSSLKKIDREGAALLTEKKYPELNNSLINSAQLGEFVSDSAKDKFFSSALIHELLARTQNHLTKLNADSVIEKGQTTHSRNLFLSTLALGLVATFIIPDFWQHALKNSNASIKPPQTVTAEKNISKPALAEPVYTIHDLALTLNYPAYTRLSAIKINPSDGAVKALPGTEVLIEGKINQAVQTASLVINEKDSFLMESKKDSTLSGSFMVREKGFYQFRVKGHSGTRTVVPQKFPIEVEKDQKPRILLFPANPKPVYFDTDKIQIFYEGSDDFGIRSIELVAQIDEKTIRKNIKNLKNGEKASQGRFTWNLALESLKAGQEIQYYLEIKDNDNVSGPNKNQSEMIRFTIFDTRKEQENLVRLQDELTEKMIALLATGLVEDNILKTTTKDALYGKQLLASNADALIDIIGLAQHIKTQAEELGSFPQAYMTLLNNIISGLKTIRQDKIDAIGKIQETVMKPTPVDYSLFSIEVLNDRMVTHLERDILYLIKITNRQKMDRVMDLENQLSELTEALQEEFKNLKNKNSPLNPDQLKSKLDQIQQTLKQLMEKLEQQNQSMPDEFLNSKSYKSMNMEEMMASIEKIQDLAKQGKMDEAMEQLKKMAEEFRKFAEQLNQAESSMEEMVDTEMMEQLNESTQELKDMEKKQREIIKKTSEINQELRQKQSKKFESLVKKFFEELKKDVESIRSILDDDKNYLNDHSAMKKLSKLLEKESALNQEIQALGQETIDSSLKESLAKNFAELKERQRQLSSTLSEMNSLRAMGIQDFKEKLPELQKKYDALKELAELNELNEFNMLFKSTYPEIFRWQGNMQASRNEDIGGKIRDDLKKVTRLNAEISKKLGSLKRSIETSNESLLSKEAKNKLQKMAQQEKAMQGKTKGMQKQFSEMNKRNPLLPPSLAQNMQMAGKNLQRAESRLQNSQVQRGIESENKALKQIQDAQSMLSEMKKSGSQMSQQGKQQNQLRLGTGSRKDSRRGGAVRMQKEKVLLPSDDQYKVPSEFREDILDAMKKQTPKNYEQLVNEYYRELVQ